jgi:hypothetical protein
LNIPLIESLEQGCKLLGFRLGQRSVCARWLRLSWLKHHGNRK